MICCHSRNKQSNYSNFLIVGNCFADYSFVHIQRLVKHAKIPTKTKGLNASLDLYSTQWVIIPPSTSRHVNTGIAVKKISEGNYGFITPSNLLSKRAFIINNSVAPGSDRECLVQIENLGSTAIRILPGEIFARMSIF